MERHRKKPFYGWVIVCASLIILTMGNGIYGGTNSAFVEPICSELGLARGEFTLYRTIISLVGALILPFYAKLLKRQGVKRVLFLGAIGIPCTYLFYSMATSLWHFYLAAIWEGLFTNGISFLCIGTILNDWFESKRGLVTGIAFAGTGLGSAIFMPIVGALIGRIGWRWAYRSIAMAGACSLLLIILLLIRNKPAELGLSPYRQGQEKAGNPPSAATNEGLTHRQAKRTLAYHLMLIGFFCISICCGGPYTHNTAFFSGIGYSTAFATSVTSAYMVFVAIGKIMSGTLFDKLGTVRTMILVSCCCIGFPVLALFAKIAPIPWIYAMLLGFSGTGPSVAINIVVDRVFGSRDFTSIFSTMSIASTLGTAISAPLMGLLYDLTGAYTLAWLIWIGFALLMAICLNGSILLAQRTKSAASR